MISSRPLTTSDFDYQLPDDLIAQRPVEPRDSSRLLCLDKATGAISHRVFSDLPSLLRAGDRLVFNDTRVIPARMFCIKPESGIRVELLFIRAATEGLWETMGKPARRLKEGTILVLEDDPSISLRIHGSLPEGTRLIGIAGGPFPDIESLLEARGHMPLPPYIERADEGGDRETYQTVFARNRGAIAAPTAGLHMTDSLLARLAEKRIDSTWLTLHVGIGTFRPVKEEDPSKHPMHEEEYSLSAQAAAEIAATRAAGGRIIALGTTVVRTLEHCALPDGSLQPGSGRTRIFIRPGYDMKVVDALITNFHLPRSTLLMLVSALAGRDAVMAAYEEALRLRYRFYSYGDAMFIS